jgi:hypothetical protein
MYGMAVVLCAALCRLEALASHSTLLDGLHMLMMWFDCAAV